MLQKIGLQPHVIQHVFSENWLVQFVLELVLALSQHMLVQLLLELACAVFVWFGLCSFGLSFVA